LLTARHNNNLTRTHNCLSTITFNNNNNNGVNNNNNGVNNNNNNFGNNNNNNFGNNVARAVGDDDVDLFNDDFAAFATSDDDLTVDVENALLDELAALDDEIITAAAAFSDDDVDSSDYAIQEFDDPAFSHGGSDDTPNFAIGESGDFAAIEEEAAAFALEENLESQDFAEALFDTNEQSFTEDDVVATAVAEEGELPGDLALGEEDMFAAVLEEEGELPGDVAMGEEDIVAVEEGELPGDLAFVDDIEVENLALDGDEAAFAASADQTTLTQSFSTSLPSWGIALIVLGVFIAIACILVVIQLFIYFRSA